VKLVKPSQMNHPLRLSELDQKRIQAVLDGKLARKWISYEELWAYQDLLYDAIAAKLQTHEGSLILQ
jgi:hypothetical protein